MTGLRVGMLGVVVAAALFVSGCALTVDKVHIDYTPQAKVEKIKGAESVALSVKVKDERTVTDKSKVSVKKNGYGEEMAPILAENDIVQLMAESISAELKSRGFAVGASPTVVYVELMKFYNDFKMGFWAGTASAEVSMNVQVKSNGNNILFTRIVGAQNDMGGVQIAGGANAEMSLETAMNEAIRKLFANEEFIAALFAADKKTKGQ